MYVPQLPPPSGQPNHPKDSSALVAAARPTQRHTRHVAAWFGCLSQMGPCRARAQPGLPVPCFGMGSHPAPLSRPGGALIVGTACPHPAQAVL
eukprot:365159-Chlamydomonas_euryale.AAC.17